jgi:peptide deformylase
MAVLKVAQMGHPVLRQVAKPVPEKEIATPEIQSLIVDMVETMDEYNGRGLAAPQVHVSLRVIVMIWDFEPNKKPYLQVLINPELELLTQETSTFWEGCLSVTGLIGKVSRPNRLMVKALDRDGKKLQFIAEGFAATVVQHECDHLDGKLYVDRITDMKSFAFVKEYQKFLASPDDGDVETPE